MTLLSNQTLAGDVTAGAEKAATCAACHGKDGNSVNPQWPSLAGQNESYLIATLQAFKDDTRSDVLMGAQAAALSKQDMADLATYFASQPPARRTADPDLVDTGGRLYRGGNKATGISACIACHGPTGQGNAPAAYPAVAGQHAAYTAKQLNDYKNGVRTSDGKSQIMRNITEHLSTDEIAAVAAYMQGLY
ncbi:MAG: cytochrome c4 [Gammaproteobacteria bacterium]|nr:MAG: cytochrome c4 [Gammaproteobacteria bacterium]